MAANFKPDALKHLADSLSEDVLNTPADQLLAEVAEDSQHRGVLVSEFDAMLRRGAKRDSRRRFMERLRQIGGAVSLRFAALASAPIVGVAIAFIVGAYYLDGSFRSSGPERPTTLASSTRNLRQAPAVAAKSTVAAPKDATRVAAAAPAPAPPPDIALSRAEAAPERLGAAAMQGQREAQASLGILLVEGRGVPRDVARGLSWLILAKNAPGPNEDWITNAYANALGQASESDRRAARSYADDWLEHHPLAGRR